MTEKRTIPKKHRRNLLDVVLLDGHGFHGAMDGMAFLERIWNLTEMPSTDRRYRNAWGDVQTHWATFNDWDDDYLLITRLSLLDEDVNLLSEFVELCVHPRVVPDEASRKARVEAINSALEGTDWRLKETGRMGAHGMYSLVHGVDSAPHQYDIALSFAGEQREYVERVAEELSSRAISIFYDEYEMAELWGRDLVEHLDFVYRKAARYVIMFVSQEYAEKAYPTHERRSAMARAIESRQEYILPVRFDKTDVPGLQPTIVYLDAEKYTPQEVAALAAKKLQS